jgi:cytoskeletal protein CcmA (bactofilin family)
VTDEIDDTIRPDASDAAAEDPGVASPAAAGGTVCAIGAGARFDGLLSFWGTARIEGSLAGEVASRGTLEVGPAATVVGRVEVDVLIVEGAVEGEVFARERVEVLPGAQVTATIRTPRLAVAEGARFEGRLDMVRGLIPAP